MDNSRDTKVPKEPSSPAQATQAAVRGAGSAAFLTVEKRPA
jgi:hypothetical protein